MVNELAAFSDQLAGVVQKSEQAVVAIHARPRFSSSGVFWRPGVVVTAEHTIRREQDITVTLANGSTIPAQWAGSDPGTDIAVLRVDGGSPLPAASTPLRAGNIALTLGRSKDSGVNATMGIISAIRGASWRTWRGGRLDDYLRLDLTLYPGSTGGAVINTSGEAIGIATSALSRIAGLAIPASTLDRVVDEILTRGRVARGYLGLGLQPVALPDHQKGLIVLSVEPNGPSANAGALIGDVLISLAGKLVEDTDDVQTQLELHKVGATIPAVVSRGGASKELSIEIGERPVRG